MIRPFSMTEITLFSSNLNATKDAPSNQVKPPSVACPAIGLPFPVDFRRSGFHNSASFKKRADNLIQRK
jgi:hypothetical protein